MTHLKTSTPGSQTAPSKTTTAGFGVTTRLHNFAAKTGMVYFICELILPIKFFLVREQHISNYSGVASGNRENRARMLPDPSIGILP